MKMTLRALAFATALFAPLGGCLVQPTNAWDDDAPPELQVKGHVVGKAAFPSVSGEAPRPPDGIKVTVQQNGSDVISEVTTTAADGGAFDFELSPGDWTVRAEHPSFAPASVGPIRVTAGDRLTVDTLVLRLPNATSSLAGTVVAQGGLSAQGVEVSLLHATGPVGCGAVEAKVTTDDAGAFRFDPIRPGSYVVVARTEGATLDVLAGDEAVFVDNDTDATLPRDLVIEPGTSVLQIEADGVFPSETTRSQSVIAHVRAVAGMTELQLGGDPTFDPSLGGSGWRPYQEETGFTLPPFEGELTVFVQMRSGCVTSPLYAARLLYDPNPPEIVTAQAGTTLIDPTDPEPALAVAGANQAGVAMTFTVLDESGVAAVHFTLTDGATSTEQVVTVSPQPGQSVVRATADIPLDEGRYTLTVRLEDVAGNITPAELAPVIAALRDVSAPTTPVPAVSKLDVAGRTALLWLVERECADGSRAPVCEVNPHPDGLFRIRGGALTDFTAFAAPPFEVPLHDAETTFEILATDAAGSTSPGAGLVTVTRQVPRAVFTAPLHKELGAPKQPLAYTLYSSFTGYEFYDEAPGAPVPFYEGRPTLTATNGTAFFSLRGRAEGAPPYYSYLIAQPAEAADVGLRWQQSTLPGHIRKLNSAFDLTNYLYSPYERWAGGLGAGAGALTWLERASSSAPRRPMRYVLHPSADGTYDLRGPETVFVNPPYFDHDGEPAPWPGYWGFCRTKGPARCAEDPWSWGWRNQLPPTETAFDGRRLVTSSVAQRHQRITGSDEGALSVAGPRIVAAVLEPQDGFGERAPPHVGAVAFRVGVPAGTVIYGVFYEKYESSYSNDEWRPLTDDNDAWAGVHIASGTGEEVVMTPHRFGVDATPIAVGLYIPPGVTVTLPRVGTPASGFPFRPVGMLDRSVVAGSEESYLPAEGASYVDDVARTLDLSVLLVERDPAGLGSLAGLSLSDLGPDHMPERIAVDSEVVANDADMLARMAEERHGQLVSTTTADLKLHTAGDDAILTVPATGCGVVVRPKSDVQVRSLTLEGRGYLDEAHVRVWERDSATSLGRYLPAYLNPTAWYPSSEELAAPDGGDCDDREPVLVASDTVSGDADVAVATSETLSVDVPQWQSLDTRSLSGNSAAGAFLHVTLDAPYDALAVTPGSRIRFTMLELSGDPDLYVRWNSPPTTGSYTCRPYSVGAPEVCDLTVPDTATAVYAAVQGYSGDNEWELTVEELEPKLRQVASYDVAGGDIANVTLTPSVGDPDLYVRYGAPPSLSSYDCRSRLGTGAVDACSVPIPQTGKVYVAVYEAAVPVTYELTTDVVRPGLVEVGSYAVSAGDLITLLLTSTYATAPRVRFDDAGEWLPFTCTGPTGNRSCTAPVPGAATLATVGVAALEQLTAFDAEVLVESVGCQEVSAGDPDAFGADSMAGVLRAGRHYLVTVGDYGNYAAQDDWPSAAPAVRMGTASSNAYFDVLGRADFTPSITADGYESQLVSGVATSRVCRLSLGVTPSVQVVRPALGKTQTAAVHRVMNPDGRVTSSVIAAALDTTEQRAPVAPAVLSTLSPGDEVAALDYHGDALLWLTHDAFGRRASVMRAFAGVFPPGGVCELHRFSPDVEVAAADLEGGRLLFAGQTAGERSLSLYEVVDDGACGSLRQVSVAPLTTLPVALALDGGDAFLWSPGTAGHGGQLAYLSLRELTPLWSSTNERVLGFDARSSDAVFSLYDGGSGAGRVVLLEGDPSSGTVRETRTLVPGGARTHLRLVGGGLASVAPSAPDGSGERRPEVRLASVAADDLSAEVTLASAAAYFPGAPVYDEDSPDAWNAQVLIESGGSTLAVLGMDDDGVRRLAIFTVPEDSASFSGLAPEHEQRLEWLGPSPAVDVLTAADGLVALTLKGSSAPVLLRRSTLGTWEELAAGDPTQERLLGLYDGKLVVMRFPGDLFVDRPPLFAEVFLRDPTTLLPSPTDPITPVGRLSSEAWLRSFAFVGPGVHGALTLYDAEAASPVLWRATDDGFFVRDDGGHRPLTSGIGALAATAPRSSGEALYFLRRQDSRVSLMRYRDPG